MHTIFNLPIYIDGEKKLLEYIKYNTGKIHIISGNAEVLKYSLQDKTAYELFAAKENIIIPDGISVYRPIKKKVKTAQKIAGIDFMQLLLDAYQNTDKKVYFLGAREAVIYTLIPIIKQKYPNLNIAGYHHGYFNINDCADIIEDITQSKANILFVALGTPNQENFIFKYMNELPCMLFMGVGGSFDVLSGTIRRAPEWMCRLGIEWLHRLFKDPSKIGRMWNNIVFTLKAYHGVST
ncbi:UDP-N-acetyl-D-mannosaminuronic acid transferase [Spirochaetia bacterium]|nr:UDP-N-acetyl-D-mannosaminuronic acid transferase [Spirochaetia bacterium]